MMAASNVLVPCGGQAAGMVLQLQQAMGAVGALQGGKVLVADRAALTPAGYFADGSFVVPGVYHPEYVNQLLDLCHSHDVRVIVPLLDIDLDRLAPHIEDFRRIGTTVVCPSPAMVELCLDKTLFEAFARREGLSYPVTYQAGSRKALDEASFPLFAKRRRGFGSIGARICRTPADAAHALESDADLIFQEFISAAEVSVDAYIAAQGDCVLRVPRLRDKVVGGEARMSHSIGRSTITTLADRTIDALARRGLRGPLNIQIFAGDTPTLIEVNTRLASASVLSNQATRGRLLATLLLEACGGIGVGQRDDYQVGLSLVRYYGDMFHDGAHTLSVYPVVTASSGDHEALACPRIREPGGRQATQSKSQ